MRKLPGDAPVEHDVHSMIRVDHAGEYGATRIYAGQLAMLRKGTQAHALVQHMAQQEEKHLAAFEAIMKQRQVRPTVMQPLWHVAGYALGAATAMMGEKAAFACTVAVESVIDEHYAAQHKALEKTEPELAQTIGEFRTEEMEHHATALGQGAEHAVLYPVLSEVVKGASRLAIWLSTRL